MSHRNEPTVTSCLWLARSRSAIHQEARLPFTGSLSEVAVFCNASCLERPGPGVGHPVVVHPGVPRNPTTGPSRPQPTRKGTGEPEVGLPQFLFEAGMPLDIGELVVTILGEKPTDDRSSGAGSTRCTPTSTRTKVAFAAHSRGCRATAG
jgi:hypothetical protein